MAWVLTSKRYKGARNSAPHTEFMIGSILIADISMHTVSGRWEYRLHTPNSTESVHTSFGEALKELHRRLNAIPSDGFETSFKKD